MRARHAAVTIASKNYLAYATTLAESYLRFHPDHDFIVALVDKADGLVPARLACGAEVIEIANFAIPDLGRFIYRYTIMELNTAVKPFVMNELLERRGYETLVYLDPDIQVFGPLASVHAALAGASIALTPHIRRPYEDGALPSDLTILQSGTYNLGFIGVRAGETAKRMLEWWSGKLYRDCVVDIPKGLFVDQKWIDLVPGFFPDHRIVHDPGCNAAYWNLHERPLSREEGRWHVGGEPLAFFHFSGYVPFLPGALSRHQNRHELRHMPMLRELTDSYAATLMANGYEKSSAHPYAFATLGNGVRLPLELVRHAMQWAAHAKVATPCPVDAPEAFSRWLMSRNVIPHRPQVAAIYHFLLAHRGDVLNAYPNAAHDSRDAAFREWVRTSGVHEYAIADLLAYEDTDAADDAVADAFQRLRAAKRDDLFARFADLWDDPAAFNAFADWFASPARRSMRFDRRHADALRRSVPAIARILNLYFLRGDLQRRFAFPGGDFAAWLRENRYALGFEPAEISLFQEFANASATRIERMRLLYAHRGERGKAAVSPFAIDERLREIGSPLDVGSAVRFITSGLGMVAADLVDDVATLDTFEQEGRGLPGLDSRTAFEFSRRAREGLASRGAGPARVNVAGYFDAPSGMGESARSLRATLAQAKVQASTVTLPHPLAQSPVLARGAAIFGWPAAGADVSIMVANADAVESAEAFLPAHFAARRNVGFWVWETQAMPAHLGKSARGLDEIWTPSRHSARAIEHAVGVPVKVLNHALDLDALDAARADRRRFGLPAEGTLFGFAFDPLSVLERKNVAGLVRAFREAFRPDDDCWLVLKVNGRPVCAYDYEVLRARAASPRILFVEGTLDRRDSHAFTRSLDAYVSLHRAEGFGLTCAEAMAMGLPVIATGYSGNLEFMDESNSLLVPARVVETDRPHGPYPAGSRWGDPDLDAAASLMRTLGSRERRSALGAAGRASVRERLNPGALGRQADTLLEALAKA
ncbi:MAG TPA: glycosyltransferase [Usitatibacter sp.]|jgi:glycosyltransferase involved in cell wall biosynthesis|nr:glycosyltransferase [Usitatibacter sp.]